jgi:hypothetical protein
MPVCVIDDSGKMPSVHRSRIFEVHGGRVIGLPFEPDLNHHRNIRIVDGSKRTGTSTAEITEPGVVIGTAPQRPPKAAVALADRRVVDARQAVAHWAILAELPIFVATGSKPVAAVVVPFIRKAHSNSVLVKRPQRLDEAIVQFSLPLAGEKGNDCIAAVYEFSAVSPVATLGVGWRDLVWIPAVPRVLANRIFSTAVSSVKGGKGGR